MYRKVNGNEYILLCKHQSDYCISLSSCHHLYAELILSLQWLVRGYFTCIFRSHRIKTDWWTIRFSLPTIISMSSGTEDSGTSLSSPSQSESRCGYCLEWVGEMNNPRVLECSHIFCLGCLQSDYRTGGWS